MKKFVLAAVAILCLSAVANAQSCGGLCGPVAVQQVVTPFVVQRNIVQAQVFTPAIVQPLVSINRIAVVQPAVVVNTGGGPRVVRARVVVRRR
jgi:hypothetical protein